MRRPPQQFFFSTQSGVTMIELLVVLAILFILLITSLFGAPKQLSRARDATRKADLDAYRKAFEQFFDDKGRYPLSTDNIFIKENCDTAVLAPYMPKLKCDPLSKQPYVVISTSTTYGIYANLENAEDPDIPKAGCANGCGLDGDANNVGDYNFGISNPPSYTTRIHGAFGAGTCNSGQCGVWCGPGFRCGSDGVYCYEDATCN